MSLSAARLTYLTVFLRKETGLAIDESKLYLIRTRLLPLARVHEMDSLDQLVDAVRMNERGKIAAEVLDYMTTNETLFFRDGYPFEILKKHLFPEIMEKKGALGRIKVWSAAASTGQEALSIAMTAMQALPHAATQVKIVGTDVSAKAISYAKEATYKQMEVQRGLPIQELMKHFRQAGEHSWQVNDQLKAMMHFQEANLISPTLVASLRHYSPFDIVFCRNVLIYFDVEQRKSAIDEIAGLTAPGGYLVTGTGEMVEGKVSKWEMVRFENRPVWRLVSRN